MFKLEKESIKEGKSSSIMPGHSETGDDVVIRRDGIEDLIYGTLGDIKVGDYVMVFRGLTRFLKTSAIVEILETTDKCIKFETETSIYTITEL